MSELAEASGARPQTSLLQAFVAHAGHVSDKWEHYIPVYQAEFARFLARGRPVRLLEIGVQNGGSLEVWSKVFPAGSSFVGIDVDPKCAGLGSPGVTIRIGDASDPAALDAMLGAEAFDIIIDDGSHRSAHVVSTFEACFQRLKPGGLYVVEDMHCSYWKSHGGGLRRAGASIEHFKDLVDALNADHLRPAEGPIDPGEVERLKRLGRRLLRVTFYDSLVFIEKLETEKHAPYLRVMTGAEAPVFELVDAVTPDPRAVRSLLLGPAATNLFAPTLLEKLATAMEAVGAARSEAGRWRETAETLRAEADARGEDTDALRAEVARQADDAQALRAEVARRAVEMQTLRAEADRRAEEAGALRAELARQGEEAQALRAESARQAIEAETLRAELARLRDMPRWRALLGRPPA